MDGEIAGRDMTDNWAIDNDNGGIKNRSRNQIFYYLHDAIFRGKRLNAGVYGEQRREVDGFIDASFHKNRD